MIITVHCDDCFMIVGEGSNIRECKELILDYIQHANPDDKDLAPGLFQVHSRGATGRYTIVEEIHNGENFIGSFKE